MPTSAPSVVDDGGHRLFPEEGPSGGCASGECLPDVESVSARAPLAPVSVIPEPVAPVPEVPVPVAPTRVAPVPLAMEPGDAESEEIPPVPPPLRTAPSGLGSQQERWRAAVESVKQSVPRQGKSLAFGRLLWIRPGEIAVGYTKADDFHRSAVSGSGKGVIERALSDFFQKPTVLLIQNAPDLPPEALPKSLAEQDAQERAVHEKSTDVRVRSHPALRAVLRILGGEVEHIQIYEQERPAVLATQGEVPEDAP